VCDSVRERVGVTGSECEGISVLQLVSVELV
jgi:hypothetical protein